MATPEHRLFAVIGHGSIFDGIAYWATLIGVYLMVGGLMFYSGKEKLFDDNGHPPRSVVTQFKGTFCHGGHPDPGLDAAAEPLRPLARRDPVALPQTA
jgi:hypothetical protein